MKYILTKYLTSNIFRENAFTRAFLELVDEIMFCCYMESKEMLSQLSFETMDDNYFLAFQSFFLNGLSTFDIKNIDKQVLSEWFSLLHVRGELSDLSKLLKFGGSLTTPSSNNSIILYNNADVPETISTKTVDGIIYAVTKDNVNLTEDFFINSQTPAGYKLGLIKKPDDIVVSSQDSIKFNLEKDTNIIIIDVGDIDFVKEKQGNIEFFRRRQFDQYYSLTHLYKSGYTINELSKLHQNGVFYSGFDLELEYIPFTSPTFILYDTTTDNVFEDRTDIELETIPYKTISDSQIVNINVSTVMIDDLEFELLQNLVEKKGYLRSSAYQSSNRALAANTEYYLYDEGSDVTVDGDSNKTYTITAVKTAANVNVDFSGATLIVSGSKLKLKWGSTASSACYIIYNIGG